MGDKSEGVAQRIQALALIEEDVPMQRVIKASGLSRTSIYRVRKIARARGFDPKVSGQIKPEYVEDAPRSGRPKIVSEEEQAKLVEKVRQSSAQDGRDCTYSSLSRDFGVSTSTIHRILRSKGLVLDPRRFDPSTPVTVPVPVPAQVSMQALVAPMQAPMQAPVSQLAHLLDPPSPS